MLCFARFFSVISIHAPPRGATRNVPINAHMREFQFTPLREGRRRGRLSGQRRGYFNSRPSARGDSTYAALCALGYISIHAPPRGATRRVCVGTPSARFQFTPLREGRLAFSVASSRTDIFQFTPLREGRPVGGGVVYIHYISIHAPPRGATSWMKSARQGTGFQFTPLREGRPRVTRRPVLPAPDFNSRPSARGDELPPVATLHIAYFNSRPSARGDESA